MASAGENVTFHVLFLDGVNNRVVVADPTLEIFTFIEDGSRIDLVEAGTEMNAGADEEGRYSYTYEIPGDYNYGSRIYALMKGTDPLSGFTIIVEDMADVYEQGAFGSTRTMTSRFIK